MAQREVVVLVCDLCDADDGGRNGQVSTHTLTVDRHAVEFEACDLCWDKRILHTFAPIGRIGRKPKQRRKPKTTPWPGTAWQFTHHALQRLGERKMQPLEVIEVIENPSTTAPGRPSGIVFWRDDVKVVADPDTRTIFTVSLRGDIDD